MHAADLLWLLVFFMIGFTVVKFVRIDLTKMFIIYLTNYVL